jgi:hypothetical protein
MGSSTTSQNRYPEGLADSGCRGRLFPRSAMAKRWIQAISAPNRSAPSILTLGAQVSILRPGVRATMSRMHFAVVAMRVLEVMFFVGLVGSTVVVLISFIEDGKELFGKDE